MKNQQSTHLEAVHTTTDDFHHADLKVVRPKFNQYINCATRGLNMQHKTYSIIKSDFSGSDVETPLPNLSHFDHMSWLKPARTLCRKKAEPVTQTVK